MSVFKGKNGTYVIAEVGGNHEGDFEYAKELARLAAASGADAVKFQIYTGDTLVNPLVDPDRNKHFKRFELNREQFSELAAICGEYGVDFLASVWNPEAFEWAGPLMPLFKVGSGDLTAYDILARTARTGKPIILSTGLATLAEVLAAVDFILRVDPSYETERKLALLQCSAMYPIPDSDANLNVMETLRKATGLPVGYSDHTTGSDAILAAVAMGAEIIEKHFTDTREGKEFRDHKVSLTRAEMQEFTEKVRRIHTLKGTGEKCPVPSELEAGHVRSFRRATYPARDLQAGHVLSADDLVTLRPCVGLGADAFYDIVGKTLKENVTRHQPLSWDLLTPTSGE